MTANQNLKSRKSSFHNNNNNNKKKMTTSSFYHVVAILLVFLSLCARVVTSADEVGTTTISTTTPTTTTANTNTCTVMGYVMEDTDYDKVGNIPVAGATVLLIAQPEKKLWGKVVTGSEGGFTFKNIPNGDYSLVNHRKGGGGSGNGGSLRAIQKQFLFHINTTSTMTSMNNDHVCPPPFEFISQVKQ